MDTARMDVDVVILCRSMAREAPKFPHFSDDWPTSRAAVGTHFICVDEDFVITGWRPRKSCFWIRGERLIWERLTFTPSSHSHGHIPRPVGFSEATTRIWSCYAVDPACGRSIFCWQYLALVGYEGINQDKPKTRGKCVKVRGVWQEVVAWL